MSLAIRNTTGALFSRFDLCAAYLVLEWDYNINGWLPERPSNLRRMESIGQQLHRMKFKHSTELCFETLSENAKRIYFNCVERLKLPMSEEQKAIKDKVSLYTKAWFDERIAESVPAPIRKFSEWFVQRHRIRGLCDPMWVCNVVALECGLGDGGGVFYATEGKAVETSRIEATAKRLMFSYSSCIRETLGTQSDIELALFKSLRGQPPQ